GRQYVNCLLGHEVKHRLIGEAAQVGSWFWRRPLQSQLIVGYVHIYIGGGGDAIARGSRIYRSLEQPEGGLAGAYVAQLGRGRQVKITQALKFGDQVASVRTARRREGIGATAEDHIERRTASQHGVLAILPGDLETCLAISHIGAFDCRGS